MTSTIRPANNLVKAYAGVAGLVVLDQLTKQMALAAVFTPPKIIEVLPFLNIVPVWNTGMSFGMLSDGGDLVKWGLTALALLVGFVLPWVARSWDSMSRFGAMLMASGAFGNAIDRIVYGAVIDFIDLFAGQYHWPAFNVADIAVTTGAGLMILSSFLHKPQKS